MHFRFEYRYLNDKCCTLLMWVFMSICLQVRYPKFPASLNSQFFSYEYTSKCLKDHYSYVHCLCWSNCVLSLLLLLYFAVLNYSLLHLKWFKWWFPNERKPCIWLLVVGWGPGAWATFLGDIMLPANHWQPSFVGKAPFHQFHHF